MPNPKYYIVYPYKMTNEVETPEGWGSFPHALTVLLKELTGAKYLGSEIKWILDNGHRRSLMTDYNVTSEDLDNYLKSDCYIFSFTNKLHRQKALEELTNMKARTFIAVNGYRHVLLTQAYFKQKGVLPDTKTIDNDFKI